MSRNCLQVGVYLFGTAYLVSPYFGWHLDVPTMTAAFGALPVAAKFGIKTVIAAPFAFHSINGFRHLIWDSGSRAPLLNSLTDNRIEEQTGYPDGMDRNWTHCCDYAYTGFDVDYQSPVFKIYS